MIGVVPIVAGCGSDHPDDEVVASFYPLAYAVAQVSGDPVTNLTPVGAEPHDLELSPSDVRRIVDSRLVVYLGQGFQPAVEQALAQRDSPSLDVLEGQTLADRPEGGLDPHVWLDPLRFAAMSEAIASALGDDARAHTLVTRLRQLDRDYRRGLAHCRRRELVTTHAAFGYLAVRYGLTQMPLAGLSPEAEPSARDVASLVRQVERSGATTIFTEPLASSKLADAIAREAGISTATLDPLEGLSQARLDAGADYFSVMQENLAAIRKALGCR